MSTGTTPQKLEYTRQCFFCRKISFTKSY